MIALIDLHMSWSWVPIIHPHTSSEVSFQLNGTFCWELVPYDVVMVVLHTISKKKISTSGECTEVVFKFEFEFEFEFA
jgi:hypothetical protein